MAKWNGKSVLIKDQPDLTMDSDASNLHVGWGAVCQELSTGGPWSRQEKTRHINCLELIAATLALNMFVKNKTGLSMFVAPGLSSSIPDYCRFLLLPQSSSKSKFSETLINE